MTREGIDLVNVLFFGLLATFTLNAVAIGWLIDRDHKTRKRVKALEARFAEKMALPTS